MSAADQQRVQAQAPVPLIVPEEKIKMAEVGLRGEVAHGLNILAAGYYGWWRNRQAQTTVSYNRASDNALTSVLALQPNGKVDVYGGELEATWQATSRLTLEGGVAYNETKIKFSTCTECIAINGQSNNVDNRLPGYAAFTGNAAATYTIPLGGNWDGFARVDYVHTGRIYDTEANVAWVKPANRVNMRVGVNDGAYKIELFVTNILNNKTPLGIARATDPYVNVSTLAFTPPPRRAVGARLAMDF